MSQDRIAALRTELAWCEQTGNPRAEQVRAALEAADAPSLASPPPESEPKPAPKPAGPVRRPRPTRPRRRPRNASGEGSLPHHEPGVAAGRLAVRDAALEHRPAAGRQQPVSPDNPDHAVGGTAARRRRHRDQPDVP